jgi:hypothetical protein
MKRIIKDKGAAKRVVNSELIAKTLGAEDTGVKIDTRRGPISLFTLRQILVDRLYSTGGRPGLRGTKKTRSKISFFEEDWKKIEKISKYYREDGINVTSSQIASALIHAEISKIDTSKIKLK